MNFKQPKIPQFKKLLKLLIQHIYLYVVLNLFYKILKTLENLKNENNILILKYLYERKSFTFLINRFF